MRGLGFRGLGVGGLGVEGLGVRGSRFRGLGVRGLGVEGLGVRGWVSGLRVQGLGKFRVQVAHRVVYTLHNCSYKNQGPRQILAPPQADSLI